MPLTESSDRRLDVGECRTEFPILDRYAFLDNAGVAPVPTRSLQASSDFARHYAGEGITHPWDAMETTLQDVREAYASLVGASVDEVIPVATSSESINAVAHAIDLRPGDNVITNDLEYPSNFYPWINLQSRGIEVRIARTTGGRLTTDDIAPLVDGYTRVITVSHVAYLTGYRCDLESIAGLARHHEILTVVDATQSVGAVRLDVASAGVDVVAVSGLKWLLSPIGTGMLYVRADVLDRLVPAYASWMSMEDHQAKGLTKVAFAPDARRFMVSGNFDLAAYTGMTESLRWLQELGTRAIEERVLALTGRIIEGCLDAGLTTHTPSDPARRAGIVTIRIPEPQRALERMAAAGVHAVARLDGVRLSPHFFNTESEIDAALEALT